MTHFHTITYCALALAIALTLSRLVEDMLERREREEQQSCGYRVVSIESASVGIAEAVYETSESVSTRTERRREEEEERKKVIVEWEQCRNVRIW